MKLFLRTICITLLLAVPAQHLRAQTAEVAPGVRVTKKTFDAPIMEQPFYGFAEKAPELKAADEKFIAAVIQVAGTREKAFEETVRRGWSAFFANNIPEATRRFNQAFLLDPAQSQIYHGFAIITQVRFNDSEYADELFRVARTRTNPSRNLNADYGRFLLIVKKPREAQGVLEQAVKDDPDFGTAWSNLGVARFLNGDRTTACAAADEAAKRDNPANVKADITILRTQAQCK